MSPAENARNLTSRTNLPLSIKHYLNNMALLTNQWSATNYKDTDRQRIYLKDIDCPPVWREKLKDILPPFLFYLNESTGSVDGEIAKSGDLMSSLPPEMRAENLMCYLGHEGTYTPSHREMCASLGHNIMVETSTGATEDGAPTRPGSSIWFMTETKDRHLVSEYWLSTLGHDIEIENHFAQVNAWKTAPFKTYVVEQRVGDFILIPPLAPHQVWNRGTRTMKVAWNRTTVETLEMAINEALPKARMVCRDEQYKNKAIVYYSLIKYADLLTSGRQRGYQKLRQLQKDFRRLFSLYTKILLSESFSRDLSEPKNMEYLPYNGNVTCSYCRCNIFNRFLTCPSCIGKMPDGDDDTYDICMECYAMGRSCFCISKLRWAEQFKWKDLTRNHEIWRCQVLQFESKSFDATRPPQPLLVEREGLGKKTLAEVCQEELKRRPWADITKPIPRRDNKEVAMVNEDGSVRKRRKVRRSEKFNREHRACHICKAQEQTWKLSLCSACGLSYCYGSLFRAFDILPQTVMEDLNWKCPKCRKICSCGACRRDPTMKPFEPSGTSLGHDTRKVADPRSVESLVDFGHSNLAWLKKVGDHPQDNQNSRRLRRRFEEAEKAKSGDLTLDEHYVGSEEAGILRLAELESITVDPALTNLYQQNGIEHADREQVPIDPALAQLSDEQAYHEFVVPSNAVFREDMLDRYQATEAITFEYADPEGPQVGAGLENRSTSLGSSARRNTVNYQSLETAPVDDINNGVSENTIIQSDVLPIDPNLDVQNIEKGRRLIRVEDDEDFNPRRGRRGTTTNVKNKSKLEYLDYSSSSSDEGSITRSPNPVVLSESNNRRSTRRVHAMKDKFNTAHTAIGSQEQSKQSFAKPLYKQAVEATNLPRTPVRTAHETTIAEDSTNDLLVLSQRKSRSLTPQAENNRRAKLMAERLVYQDTASIDHD